MKLFFQRDAQMPYHDLGVCLLLTKQRLEGRPNIAKIGGNSRIHLVLVRHPTTPNNTSPRVSYAPRPPHGVVLVSFFF